jgi:hypothetical protein
MAISFVLYAPFGAALPFQAGGLRVAEPETGPPKPRTANSSAAASHRARCGFMVRKGAKVNEIGEGEWGRSAVKGDLNYLGARLLRRMTRTVLAAARGNMRQISSKQTFWVKRVSPTFMFAILALVTTNGLIEAAQEKSWEILPFVAIPTIIMVFGYFLFRHLVFDLADEVVDAGDALVVKRNGITVTIPLADIVNIDASSFSNPPRIVLALRTETPLGRKIAFMPQYRFSLNPFAINPLKDELIVRIDQARSSRAGKYCE